MGFVTHAHLTGPKKIKKLVRECRYLTSRLTPYLVRVPTRPNFKKKEPERATNPKLLWVVFVLIRFAAVIFGSRVLWLFVVFFV